MISAFSLWLAIPLAVLPRAYNPTVQEMFDHSRAGGDGATWLSAVERAALQVETELKI